MVFSNLTQTGALRSKCGSCALAHGSAVERSPFVFVFPRFHRGLVRLKACVIEEVKVLNNRKVLPHAQTSWACLRMTNYLDIQNCRYVGESRPSCWNRVAMV